MSLRISSPQERHSAPRGRFFHRLLSLSMVLALHSGCGGPLSSRSQLPPPQPIFSSLEPIWQHLVLRRETYQDLKGVARLRLHTATGGGTLDNVAVVLGHFDALRLEGIGPFGQLVFLFVSDGQRFSFYVPQERRVISGPASTQQFIPRFGLAVEPKVLPSLLLGDVPLRTLPKAGTLTYHAADNLYVWEGIDPLRPWQYRIWFDPYRLFPVRFEAAELSGKVVLQVAYEDFRRLEGFLLPYRITITQPLTEQRVIWHYHEVQLNTGVTPALFRLRVPPGVEQVELQ